MSGHDWRILFARSLFLPRDLGGNRYPYEVVRRLGERGHPVTVATPCLHDAFPDLRGVRYRFYPVSRRHPALTHLSNLWGAAAAFRGLRPARYPVALSGSYDTAAALRIAGVVPATPLVFLYHSEFYSEWVQGLGHGPRALARRGLAAYMRRLERTVLRASARIVAVSQFSARQISERAPEVAERVVVIPTGVDTTYFVPAADRAAARREVGARPHRLLALGVGRLVGVKRFDLLVEAFATAVARGLDADLVIAGDGPERPRLAQMIAAAGLVDRVRLAGYCDPPALRALMQAADLQVCTSAFENFSLAILEGMACGAPVLGTSGGGIPEQVAQVDPGLVLTDDAPGAIADALLRTLDDRERLRALGERARAVAAERYDWERVVDRLEALCDEVRRPWP